jgi:hypothetical protein
MNLLTPKTLLLASLCVVFPNEAQGQLLRDFFNSLFSPLIQRGCRVVETALGLGSNSSVACLCDLTFAGLFQGFDGELQCSSTTPRCLVGNLYCATGNIDVGVQGGLFTGSAIDSNATACFNVKSGLPSGVLSVDDICLSFKAKGLKLTNCTAVLGAQQCKSCTICASGVDFKFDCSNVDLAPGPLFVVPGPKLDNCFGLSLVPKNATARLL